jgi:hypothetical protein
MRITECLLFVGRTMVSKMELSRKTEKVVKLMFGSDEVGEVEQILIKSCSNTVPGCRDWSEESLERVWLSVLKISEGRMEDLRKAVALANTDYRDLLMSAGFGHDPEAHKRWYP